jgi:ADP-heptose:LPS heptosyltransferase
VVLRALGLGDLLTGVPALRGLARAFPDHERVLAAPASLEPLCELIRTSGGGPVMERVYDTGGLMPLGPELHGADVAVNLHGRGPESHRLLLAIGPRRLIGFANHAVRATGAAHRDDEHEVERWCRLLTQNGIPADPGDLAIDAPPRGSADPDLVRAWGGATVIHPGAASAARRWPPERFAAVARREREAGREVVVTGGPGEVDSARLVARGAGLPEETVLAGRTNVRTLAAVVAAAGRVVCGDTGVAHLATALGTPSIVLFGPTSPQHWGPPSGPRHRELWSGRTGDPHANRPDAGLLELTEDDVIAELASLDAPGGLAPVVRQSSCLRCSSTV